MEKKGITIEIDANITKLQKALRDVTKESRNIDKELKKVDKALKFNPTNIELWRQKQELLTQQIDKTSDRLRVLQEKQRRMDSGELEHTEDEYRQLQREIIETESRLKHFEGELRKVGNVNLRATSEQFKEWGNNLESAGRSMQGASMAAGALVGTLGLISYKAGTAADDLNTLSKVTGIGTDELQKYSYAADLVDVSVESIAKSNKKLTRNAYEAANGSKTQAEAFAALGVSVTDSDGNLRDSEAIFQDVIGALGQMTNETERDALAQKLMGKSAAELNPLIEDGGETYKMVADTLKKYDLDYIDQETLDKANEFNDSLDTMKLIGSVAIAQIGSQLAGYLAPALEKVVDVIGRFANWLSNLSPQVLTVIGVIAAVVAAVAPVLIVLGKISFAISSIMSLMATLGPAIGGVVAALGPVVLAIGAVIAVGVLLYKNWDTIKAKATAFKNMVVATFNDFKNKVTTTFNNIKNAIVKPMQTAIDKVKAVVEKIKSWFPINIGNIFKNVKLPHFKLNGKFSLNPPSVPKLDIDWYKNGGIFNSPAVIGIGDTPRGGEAAVPLDPFWKKMDKIAEAATGSTVINININGSNRDPREIAEEVRKVLIKEVNGRRLAWQ